MGVASLSTAECHILDIGLVSVSLTPLGGIRLKWGILGGHSHEENSPLIPFNVGDGVGGWSQDTPFCSGLPSCIHHGRGIPETRGIQLLQPEMFVFSWKT